VPRRPNPPDLPPSTTRARDARRTLGRLGEQLAATHLERLGFTILARNVRTRHGEIDLIAGDGQTLLFVEVKTGRSHARRPGPAPGGCDPLSSLRPRQRARLRRLAVAWLAAQRANGSGPTPFAPTLRFDAVGVVLDETDVLLRLDHLQGAW
jgi:putative endonuclease